MFACSALQVLLLMPKTCVLVAALVTAVEQWIRHLLKGAACNSSHLAAHQICSWYFLGMHDLSFQPTLRSTARAGWLAGLAMMYIAQWRAVYDLYCIKVLSSICLSHEP